MSLVIQAPVVAPVNGCHGRSPLAGTCFRGRHRGHPIRLGIPCGETGFTTVPANGCHTSLAHGSNVSLVDSLLASNQALDDILIVVLIIAAEDLRGYAPLRLLTYRTILRRFTFFGGQVMDM
jgi:hypothetical protein